MREIKFRCWIRFMQKMADVTEINLETGSVITNEYQYAIESDAVDLMQFTGLTDKNGVEIYEGDLIVDKDRDTGAEVEYRKRNSCFMLTSNSFITQECIDRFEYEVIGNIHQSTELLK